MKYVVVLPDGVSDVPNPTLGGRTPLQAAKHPNMDWIAREGVTGWAHTIPAGFAPGSDVGCMSVFGYDPRRYHTGRAPLEAAAQGIRLADDEVVFRCNTVAVQDGVMTDYSAGHIESDQSRRLISAMQERFGASGVQFHPGVSYRHLMVVKGRHFAETVCTPPHDISGKPVAAHLPSGSGAPALRTLMEESVGVFKDHPVNAERARQGQTPATGVWFWGQGTAATFPPFQEQYGLKAACISAVDIVRGIARLASIDVLQVPGITGYFDTDYKAKAEHALKALEAHDLVVVHVEPTDEAGHMGRADLKVKAIEDTDALVVGALLEGLKRLGEPYGVLVVCDHPTSTIAKTHIAAPVPFACYTSASVERPLTGRPRNAERAGDRPARSGSDGYNEVSIKASPKRFEQGFELMRFFLNQKSV